MKFLEIVYFAIPVVLAITVHEVAHGWVAKLLGDDTAASQGRLSLNPLRHVDPIGTILVPALLYFLSGPLFGWAKPVPVNWRRLGHLRRDMAFVAAAGPAANLLMIVIWGLLLALGLGLGPGVLKTALRSMCSYGIIINAVLMVLNLFPIPPLDGSRVVSAVLPPRYSMVYNRLEPFGLVIVLILLITGILWALLEPAIIAIDSRVWALATEYAA